MDPFYFESKKSMVGSLLKHDNVWDGTKSLHLTKFISMIDFRH